MLQRAFARDQLTMYDHIASVKMYVRIDPAWPVSTALLALRAASRAASRWPPTTSLGLLFAREHGGEENTHEALDWLRAALGFRDEDRPLEPGDDEPRNVRDVDAPAELARFDRRPQAVGHRLLILPEDSGDARSYQFAVLARFRAHVAVKAAPPHVVLLQGVESVLEPKPKPLDRRQGVVSERRGDFGVEGRVVEVNDLEAERLLRREVIRERALRNTRSLNDVSHAGSVTAFVDNSKAFGEQFFSI